MTRVMVTLGKGDVDVERTFSSPVSFASISSSSSSSTSSLSNPLSSSSNRELRVRLLLTLLFLVSISLLLMLLLPVRFFASPSFVYKSLSSSSPSSSSASSSSSSLSSSSSSSSPSFGESLFSFTSPASASPPSSDGAFFSGSNPPPPPPNVHRVKGPTELFYLSDGIQVSSYEDNCGLHHDCPIDHFPVHVFTGLENRRKPRLCIDGKYVLDQDINGNGRGINVAVVDSLSRTIVTVTNFDTYNKACTALETLLLSLREGDIIFMLTFDEPSAKLSQVTRLLLHELGSGKAQNLNYRTSWYIATQKGMTGYSPYEEIHLPTGKSSWGKPHDVRTCLPLVFEGISVQADDTIRQNQERKSFCTKYSTLWPLFCESHIINDPLIPSPVTRVPVSPDLFKTPILLLTPDSLEDSSDLSLTLETILRQPGVIPPNVVIFYNASCCSPIRHLVSLFGFMAIEYPSASNMETSPSSQPSLNDLDLDPDEDLNPEEDASYQRSQSPSLVHEVISTGHLLFPDSNQFILLEPHTILSPDFLPFMGQLIPTLHDPNTKIDVISAWNPNGFLTSGADGGAILRADSMRYPPRFGVMFRRLGDPSNVDAIFAGTGSQPSWSFEQQQEIRFNPHPQDILFPDVSRISLVIPSRIRDMSQVQFLERFMHRPRNLNQQEDVKIHNVENVTYPQNFDVWVTDLVRTGYQVHSLDQVQSFLSSKRNLFSP